MFQKKVFFLISVYGLWSEKFALSEKNNCLDFNNSVLCIQRNVLGENFCIKKLFFCKTLPGIEGRYFGLLGNLFPAGLSSFHSTFGEEGFRDMFLQKSFFSLFPDLEQKIDYWRNIRMYVKTLFYVSGGIFWGKTLFSKFYDIFLCISSEELKKLEKKIRRIVKIAFYTSKGTSWWNYFGSLKTYFT